MGGPLYLIHECARSNKYIIKWMAISGDIIWEWPNKQDYTSCAIHNNECCLRLWCMGTHGQVNRALDTMFYVTLLHLYLVYDLWNIPYHFTMHVSQLHFCFFWKQYFFQITPYLPCYCSPSNNIFMSQNSIFCLHLNPTFNSCMVEAHCCKISENWSLTLEVPVATIDAQWEGMGDVG